MADPTHVKRMDIWHAWRDAGVWQSERTLPQFADALGENAYDLPAFAGASPLTWAIQSLHSDAADPALVQTLLDAGADPNRQDMNGQTPLCAAAVRGDLGIVTRLVGSGAAADGRDAHGRTPLMLAAFFGHLGVLGYLLRHGGEVKSQDVYGRTAFDFAASCRIRRQRKPALEKLKQSHGGTIVRRQHVGILDETTRLFRQFSAHSPGEHGLRACGRFLLFQLKITPFLLLPAWGLCYVGLLIDVPTEALFVFLLFTASFLMAAVDGVLPFRPEPWRKDAETAVQRQQGRAPLLPDDVGVAAVAGFARIGGIAAYHAPEPRHPELDQSERLRRSATLLFMAVFYLAVTGGIAALLAFNWDAATPMISSISNLLILLVASPAVAAAAAVVYVLCVAINLPIFRRALRARRFATSKKLSRFVQSPAAGAPQDPGPFILYLRSFSHDRMQTESGESFENLFVAALGQQAPVVAIGLDVDGLGAARIQATDDEWQDHVRTLAAAANAIVMIPDVSEGVLWEINLLTSRSYFGKTAFVMPPRWGAGDADIDGQWTKLLGEMDRFGLELPLYSSRGGLFRLDDAGRLASWSNVGLPPTPLDTVRILNESSSELPIDELFDREAVDGEFGHYVSAAAEDSGESGDAEAPNVDTDDKDFDYD